MLDILKCSHFIVFILTQDVHTRLQVFYNVPLNIEVQNARDQKNTGGWALDFGLGLGLVNMKIQ